MTELLSLAQVQHLFPDVTVDLDSPEFINLLRVHGVSFQCRRAACRAGFAYDVLSSPM
jgi:hypothetical protein